MNSIKAMNMALAQARRRNPEATDEEVREIATDLFHEWMAEAAREREEQGIEDTPCIESCDTGTGEGRWHGVIK